MLGGSLPAIWHGNWFISIQAVTEYVQLGESTLSWYAALKQNILQLPGRRIWQLRAHLLRIWSRATWGRISQLPVFWQPLDARAALSALSALLASAAFLRYAFDCLPDSRVSYVNAPWPLQASKCAFKSTRVWGAYLAIAMSWGTYWC